MPSINLPVLKGGVAEERRTRRERFHTEERGTETNGQWFVLRARPGGAALRAAWIGRDVGKYQGLMTGKPRCRLECGDSAYRRT